MSELAMTDLGQESAASRPAKVRRIMRSTPVQVAIYLVIIGIAIYAAYAGSMRMGYNWQWYNIPKYIYSYTDDGFQVGELITGLGASLGIAGVSFLLAIVIGLGLALLRLSNLIVGRGVALCLLEFLRNVPLLVQVYLFYYVLGPIFGWDRLVAAILCLGVFHGALVSEIIRAGISAVPRGQWEGADSIGMSRIQAYRYIVLPQAIRLMLPPMTNEAIQLVKSSAIVSVIGVAELTTTGRNLISDTYMSFEIWFVVALIYFVVTLSLSFLASGLEHRLHRADR